MVFPIIKLASLFIKQLSKPLAVHMKQRAKSHPFFRNYICMPPAQLYHWADVNIRMRMLGLGKAGSVEPLSESMAIELGAEMLGEFIIFSIASGTLYFEYQRSSKKEQIKEEERKQEMREFERRVEDLGIITEKQDAHIRELWRIVSDLESKNTSLMQKMFGPSKKG
ncbi:hypothetical protein ScPMuIL_013759 [Solemya velum]